MTSDVTFLLHFDDGEQFFFQHSTRQAAKEPSSREQKCCKKIKLM